MTAVVIVAAEVDGRPGQGVRLGDGKVVAIGPEVGPSPGETVLDLRGGAVIPGLHDHHLHLRSAVAAAGSVPLNHVASDDLAAVLRTAADERPAGSWLRAIGAGGRGFEALDRDGLDRVVGNRPVRIQHRSGALWLLNSAAIDELGVAGWTEAGVERDAAGRPTGRLWRLDDRLRAALPAPSTTRADWRSFSDRAAAFGITGFTDATPDRDDDDAAELAALVADGVIRQRLHLMTPADRAGASDSTGRGRVTRGAHKILLDDPRLPSGDQLAAVIDTAHRHRRPVAVHCVTADQLVVAADALATAGGFPGDRIEHAGVVPPGYAHVLADLGVTVVTQPGFIAARGDAYRRDVPAEEQSWLYPCASLRAAGVGVAASSDAPFGPLDPWAAMATATTRRTASGATVAAGEAVDAMTALALYLGSAENPARLRTVAVGEPADLCLLRAPLAEVLRDPSARAVRATVIAGDVIAAEPVGGAR
jgi:predicted amidohydrolase YtcJ